MIISLPFWILSICIAFFVEKPEDHPHLTRADQASKKDPNLMTAKGFSVPAQNDAGGTGTPAV